MHCARSFFIAATAVCVGCQPTKPTSSWHTVVFTPLPDRFAPALTATTVDSFLSWLLTMPGTSRDAAVTAIDGAASDPAVVSAVIAQVPFSVPMSYERRLVLLATIGEMQKPAAIPILIAFVETPECPVFEERAALQKANRDTIDTTYFDECAGLKSQAASMLAHIPSPDADNAVLMIVGNHPSRAVRLSAIDAYLYNHHDSAEARDRLAHVAKPNDALMLDAIRITPESTPASVARGIADFYRRHPKELPPAPALHGDIPAPPARHAPTSTSGSEEHTS